MKYLAIVFSFLAVLGFSACSSDSSSSVAEMAGKDVSAYLQGAHVEKDAAIEKLKSAGFEIVTTYKPVKGGTTIVFTNDALKAQGAKKGRAFASVLRLFVDDKEKKISFTNPIYFGKAFMQDEYDHGVFAAQKASIEKAFTGLKGSVDKMKFDDLAGYHFMTGMPYYSDVDTLGEASNEELLAKVKKYKKGKNVLFTLKLSKSSTLVGYDLSKRTKKFVKKIGRANGAVLPYCISIEDGKAVALEAKYYLAVSYPLLTMTEFTTIATVPGAVSKELTKPFKK